MKALSIVIPFYKEKAEEIFPLLSTIATQKGINFSQIEVILVNDGYYNDSDNVFNSNLLRIYSHFETKIIHMAENRGSGVARQVGLENAIGKYVMFCDCDDLLHNVGILGAMLTEIQTNDWDYLSTSWLEECVDDNTGNVSFFTHEMEQTWLHGKMFRRAVLVENDIAFHPDLRVHEDTYFLSVLCDITQKRGHMPLTSYIWTHKPTSITRKDNAIYSFNSMGVFVQAVLFSAKNLRNRKKDWDINYKITQLLCYIYLITQSTPWQEPEAQPYLYEMEQSLKENMVGFWEVFDNLPDGFLAEVYWQEFSKCPRALLKVQLSDWISGIRGES